MLEFTRQKLSENRKIAKQLAPFRRHFFRYYCRWATWYYYGKNWKTPIDPFNIIYIDPTKVNEIQNKKNYFKGDYISEVLDGGWDSDTNLLNEYDLYTSIRRHFEQGASWKETKFYDRVVSNIREQPDWNKWGCSSIEDFHQRLNDIDDLYTEIETHGFKTQKQVVKDKESDPIYHGWRSLPIELYEVAVVIDRNGQYALFEGRHRLTIAQCLNLNKIPVRIKARHIKWQQYREDVINDKNQFPHPDLQFSE